jgi:predicted TIM-barrel fold metal-dependent hydrolase
MLDSAPTLTASERARVLRDNAVRVYRLPVT